MLKEEAGEEVEARSEAKPEMEWPNRRTVNGVPLGNLTTLDNRYKRQFIGGRDSSSVSRGEILDEERSR